MTTSAHQHSITASFVNAVHSDNKVEIMIDSGAATHVCPTWFAPDSPLYTLQQGQGPNLRTATDEEITIHRYKWVLMTNQQLPNSSTILRVWRQTTHHVSNKTDWTRIWHTVQRCTNNVTQQRLSCRLGTTCRTLLLTNATSENPRQHETWGQQDWHSTYSKHYTSHNYTNRNGNCSKQKWHLDIQQSRVPGEDTQDNKESTFCARQQMSNTNRQAWKLQKHNCPQKEWQRRRLRRQVPRPQQVTTKESPTRTNLDWRNMVQSEERNTPPWQRSTTATSIAFSGSTIARDSKDINTSSKDTTTTDETHHQKTTWQSTTATAKNTNNYVSSTSKGRQTNNWLLTIGSKKDTCGKEYMFNREWTCTLHNNQMMDLM